MVIAIGKRIKPLLLSDGKDKYYCKCGCNKEIPFRKSYIYSGIPNYIIGHGSKGRKTKGRPSPTKGMKFPYKPRPRKNAEEWNKKIAIGRTGKKHSKETREKIAESHMGCKSHFWKGGGSFTPYCPKFNDRLKEKIRDEYGRKCYICGKYEKDNILSNGVHNRLPIHHLDMDKGQGCNGKKWKLVPLCSSCHSKEHNNIRFKKKSIIYPNIELNKICVNKKIIQTNIESFFSFSENS